MNYYLFINIVTLISYVWDKQAAKMHRERIPERILLFLGILGGAPAALAAMNLFRHKTRKKKFYIINVLSLIVHVVISYRGLKF